VSALLIAGSFLHYLETAGLKIVHMHVIYCYTSDVGHQVLLVGVTYLSKLMSGTQGCLVRAGAEILVVQDAHKS
jgi:hypothetical protein